MSSRDDRAERRRASWSAEVVAPGSAKGPLYAELELAERLLAFVELNERAWLATGNAMPSPIPRSAWPIEVFECRRRAKDLADLEVLERD